MVSYEVPNREASGVRGYATSRMLNYNLWYRRKSCI